MTIEYEASHSNDEFVRLTDVEIDMCARFGIEMRKESLNMGLREHAGYDSKSKMAIKIQALGAVCEGAAQAALGWPIKLQSGTYAVADLDGDIQVRLIGVDHYGLRVKPKDKDHWRVFGVIIPAGKERQPYRLPGWVYAGEAREHSEWLMNPNNRTPMWAVPQSALRPNNELRMLLDKEGFTTNTDRLL